MTVISEIREEVGPELPGMLDYLFLEFCIYRFREVCLGPVYLEVFWIRGDRHRIYIYFSASLYTVLYIWLLVLMNERILVLLNGYNKV